MENIINYVENFGNFSFEEKPFNDVDSLVFSQLVYLRFNKGVPNLNENCKAIKLADVLDHIDSPKEFFVAYDTTSIKLLFLAVISSRRYKNTKLNYKMLKTDGNEEMQFFALSFLLENGDTYVAFRGTDGTIIGWKEDFNMSFMDEIPSQIEAVRYINSVAPKLSGKIIVGGHSKGGNLAIYSAVKCDDKIKDRIVGVYNHDGPGFSQTFLESSDFAKMKDKIHITFPRSSMVGMMLEQHGEHKVVNSSSYGAFQHNGFTWEVDGDDFDYASDVNMLATTTHKVTNDWLVKVDSAERQRFIDTLYDIIKSSNATTLAEFQSNWRQSAMSILKYSKGLDKETVKFIFQTMGQLVSSATKSTFKPKEK